MENQPGSYQALLDYLAMLALQPDFIAVCQCTWAEETRAEQRDLG